MSSEVSNLEDADLASQTITAVAIGALAYCGYRAISWMRQIDYQAIRHDFDAFVALRVPLNANPAQARLHQQDLSAIRAIGILRDANPDLITPENHDALFQNRENAIQVERGLGILRDANLITQENFNALIQSGANAAEVGGGLASLGIVNPALITEENRAALIQSGANAREVARGLEFLFEFKPALITQENFNTLIQSGADAFDVGWGLLFLGRVNPALITPENRNALIQSGENAEAVARGLAFLERANPALITQENFNALLAGNGARARMFIENHPNFVENYQNVSPLVSQNAFEAIMRELDEKAWGEPRNAAVLLGLYNLLNPKLRLPPEIVGRIAALVAPPDAPREAIAKRAWDVAKKVESRGYSQQEDDAGEVEL